MFVEYSSFSLALQPGLENQNFSLLISAAEIASETRNWNSRVSNGILPATVPTVVTVVAVALRLLSRRVAGVRLELSDYAILVALTLVLGFAVQVYFLLSRYGAGHHLLAVSRETLATNIKITFAMEITYYSCHLAIKMSMLHLYKQLFTLESSRFRAAWYLTAVVSLIAAFGGIIVSLVQCQPIHYMWDAVNTVMEGSCISWSASRVAIFLQGAFNLFSDFALLIMPLPALWRLNVPLSQKLQISGIFTLGALACASGVVRIVFLSAASDSIDITYAEVYIVMSSLNEANVAIISACLITLRPLLRLFHRRRRTPFASPFSSTSTNKLAKPKSPIARFFFRLGTKTSLVVTRVRRVVIWPGGRENAKFELESGTALTQARSAIPGPGNQSSDIMKTMTHTQIREYEFPDTLAAQDKAGTFATKL